MHNLYLRSNGDCFILRFLEIEVTYFTILRFFAKDELGEFIECYVEESGIVINDVIDGITMISTRNKQSSRSNYLKFVNTSKALGVIAETELLEKVTLSIHGQYTDPF